MSFAESLADDADAILNTNEFAETVIYTPQGGSPTSVTAVIEYGEDETEDGIDGDTRVRHARLHLAIADVADPAPNDTVTINSEDWHVEAVESRDDAMAVLRITRAEAVERRYEGTKLRRG